MNFFKTRGFIYVVAILIAVGAFYAGDSMRNESAQINPVDLKQLQAGSISKTVGTPLVGGAFELTDHNGKDVTEKDYLGKHLLIYFGYTYCPDVCPTSLQVMIDALEAMGPDAEKVIPMFITIDPERDTPEVLKEYVSQFDSRLIGLTGSKEAIKSVAKAYRVYRAKVEDEGAEGKDMDYLMDHTSITYLMGPDSKFKKHFAHGYEPTKMAERIKSLL
ncbi:MAG: SCO family protein [Alphaproteobacteria bacterium]|nr:SCO family protein [Alphaproteobacteria bacterium]